MVQFKISNETLDALYRLQITKDDGLISELVNCLEATQDVLYELYNKMLLIDDPKTNSLSVIPIMYIYSVYIKSKIIADEMGIPDCKELDDLTVLFLDKLTANDQGKTVFDIAMYQVHSLLDKKFSMKAVTKSNESSVSTEHILANMPISYN